MVETMTGSNINIYIPSNWPGGVPPKTSQSSARPYTMGNVNIYVGPDSWYGGVSPDKLPPFAGVPPQPTRYSYRQQEYPTPPVNAPRPEHHTRTRGPPTDVPRPVHHPRSKERQPLSGTDAPHPTHHSKHEILPADVPLPTHRPRSEGLDTNVPRPGHAYHPKSEEHRAPPTTDVPYPTHYSRNERLSDNIPHTTHHSRHERPPADSIPIPTHRSRSSYTDAPPPTHHPRSEERRTSTNTPHPIHHSRYEMTPADNTPHSTNSSRSGVRSVHFAPFPPSYSSTRAERTSNTRTHNTPTHHSDRHRRSEYASAAANKPYSTHHSWSSRESRTPEKFVYYKDLSFGINSYLKREHHNSFQLEEQQGLIWNTTLPPTIYTVKVKIGNGTTIKPDFEVIAFQQSKTSSINRFELWCDQPMMKYCIQAREWGPILISKTNPTIKEVLNAIYEYLRTPLTRADLHLICSKPRNTKSLENSRSTRVIENNLHNSRDSEIYLRSDVLGGYWHFKGIRPTRLDNGSFRLDIKLAGP